MAWQYHIGTGTLLDKNGKFQGTGYSGTGPGRNNVAMQSIQGVGPLPEAKYTIGSPYSDPVLGPIVMHLDPEPGQNVFGRSLFRIHGDNARHDASHGCLILGPAIRQLISISGDHELVVTA